jgi:hypothetical protein
MIINPLTETDLALLHSKFVVPMVVQEMLRGLEPLDDVAEYSMHDILGELQPDTALLCIALCAQHVGAHTAHLPIGKMLELHAERIVDEYGALWLAYERSNITIDDEQVAELLVHIPEDLEAMGDMLLALCGDLEEDHAVSAILCDILGTEAHMHMEFAEMKLEKLAILDTELEDAIPVTAAISGGNVVAFPQYRKQMAARKL